MLQSVTLGGVNLFTDTPKVKKFICSHIEYVSGTKGEHRKFFTFGTSHSGHIQYRCVVLIIENRT